MVSRSRTMYYRDFSGKLEMRCPGCGEELQAADVEIFPYCPFCNQALPRDSRLEDFILEPVIRHWIGKNQSLFNH